MKKGPHTWPLGEGHPLLINKRSRSLVGLRREGRVLPFSKLVKTWDADARWESSAIEGSSTLRVSLET